MVTFVIQEAGILEMIKNLISSPPFAITLLCLTLLFFILWLVVASLSRSRKKEVKQLRKERDTFVLQCKELSEQLKEIKVNDVAQNAKFEELIKTNERLNKLAYVDTLTELPSRHAVNDVIEGAMLTLRTDETVILMLIDISNYRTIHKEIGSMYGDTLLVDISHRLQSLIDENDYLARAEGGQFVLFSQNISSMDTYQEKVNRICWAFEEAFLIAAKECFAVVGLGITVAPKDGKTINVLYKNAELAANIAQELGKNRYYYYEEALRQKVAEQMEIQADLRKALEEKQFMISYRPQFDLEEEQLLRLETFVRWNHPVKGLLEPSEFLPTAKENGMILGIGEQMLLEACGIRKELEEENLYPDMIMTIPLSQREFWDREFIQRISIVLENTKVAPSHIEFEIPESVLLQNFEYSIAAVNALKLLGVGCVISEFQTGFCAISNWKRVKADSVKLSKAYLESMLFGAIERKAFALSLELAEGMNFKMIAEVPEEEEIQKKFEVYSKKVKGFFYRPIIETEAMERLMDFYQYKGK